MIKRPLQCGWEKKILLPILHLKAGSLFSTKKKKKRKERNKERKLMTVGSSFDVKAIN